ncbi:MAG: hypothetical protein AB8G22_22700 [Saprospiraceae bacterium]
MLLLLFLIIQSLNTTALTSLELNQIYLNLQTAIGDQSRTFPALEIRPGASSVLAYNQRKNIIFVDEKVMRICDEFGENAPDAIAFLLAHEMTHFYQKHQWEEAGFASEFLTKQSTFNEHEEDERAADLYGAFVTHLAGYQSVKLIPALFEKVYQAYGLEADLLDYPPLSERQAVAQQVCQQAKELILLFDTANYLNAIGEHLAAATAYEHLLQLVRFKELYNNLGASLVAEAARMSTATGTNFRYPLVLDWDIPLRDGAADRAELLEKAIGYLAQATQMDATHYNAFINLACAYTLSDKLADAKTLLKQMQGLPQDAQQLAEVNILLGIIKAKSGQKAEAETIFKAVTVTASSGGIQQLAQQNISILKQEIIKTGMANNVSSEQQIGGIDLLYQNEFAFEEMDLFDTFTTEENALQFHETTTARLLHFVTSDKTIALLFAKKNAQLTTEQLGVNTPFATLQTTYPNGNILPHNRGYYYVVPSHHLVFRCNQQNKVVEWGTYAVY